MIDKEYLKTKRIKYSYSQNSLGKEIGVSGVAIGYIESGVRMPSIKSLINLCKVLDLDANKLLKL